MPEVAFHTGLADKGLYTCRLLRKAWRQGARVVVTGTPEALNRLDALLWTFEHEEFVPHARRRAGARPEPGFERTPVWLADDAGDVPDAQVLVNLGPDCAPGCERFARVIEIVGDDADEVQAGRRRWRQHKSTGVEPTLHDTTAAASGVSRSRDA